MSEFFNHLFGEIFSIICYAFCFALIMWLIRLVLKPKAYITLVRALNRGYKLAMILLPILFVLAFLIILPFSIIMHPNEWRAIGENINDHFRQFFSPTLATLMLGTRMGFYLEYITPVVVYNSVRNFILSLTALANLTMAFSGSVSAQGVPTTVASLQSQVTALQSQIASLQNAVKNVGSVGPKRVQFQSAASNQIAFINPETANDTNIVVVNGLSQMPPNLPVDTFGNQYKLAVSISNTTPDDSWATNTSGQAVVAAGTPQYTAIYHCPHIIGSGNNTIAFPSSQPVKIT